MHKYIVYSMLLVPTFGDEDRRNPCNINLGWQQWASKFSDQVNMQNTYENKINNKAKNVVLFVGDGMGISTITAGRLHAAHTNSANGKCNMDFQLSFDKFPHSGMIKNWNLDFMTADSGSTATAMMNGAKTHNMYLGYPHLDKWERPTSIGAYAKSLGKKVGIVTTTTLNHGTPGAMYAHSDNRWDTKAVTKQFFDSLSPQGHIDLALGGGLSLTDSEFEDAAKTTVNGVNRLSVSDLTGDTTPALEFPMVGSFGEKDQHIPYADEPRDVSLPLMAGFAVKKLMKNDGGFFLLVEGGRIDHAHHDNLAGRALGEVEEFHRTIAEVESILDNAGELDDTLILVTADHSHQFTMGSYQNLDGSLFDPVPQSVYDHNTPGGKWTGTAESLPFMTLNYVTGPGGNHYADREAYNQKLAEKAYHNPSQKFPSMVDIKTSAHAGEDVAVFAKGPWGKLVAGTHDQTSLYYIMKKAMTDVPTNPFIPKPIHESVHPKVLEQAKTSFFNASAIYFYVLIVLLLVEAAVIVFGVRMVLRLRKEVTHMDMTTSMAASFMVNGTGKNNAYLA